MWVGDGFLAFNLLSVFFRGCIDYMKTISTAFAKFLKGGKQLTGVRFLGV
jgi:hypothetical protein